VSAALRSRNNVFSGLALDRCAERRGDADWIAAQAARADARHLLLRDDGHALVEGGGEALALLDARARNDVPSSGEACFLGIDEADVPYFVLAVEAAAAEHAAAHRNGGFMDLRRAGIGLSAFESGLFAYARALTHWQTRTRWCGACGGALTLEWSGHRARCTLPSCGIEHYPRTDPAIIVIVTWRDACLLGRQPSWPSGRWSTLAGFVEPGETLEDAVRREVREEAGVRVVDCDYHSSQPWPFPASLMLGFTARADDPAIQVGAELAEARWFEVDEFVHDLQTRAIALPPPVSVSYRLIEHWLRSAGGLELSACCARS
jgi:NAD+ diphosphatase